MHIVIDVPKETYNAMVNNLGFGTENETMLYSLLYRTVVNGTPLPKGHGRLIDADKTLKSMDTYDKFGYTETGAFVREPTNDYVPYVHYEDMIECVCNSTTILEA